MIRLALLTGVVLVLVSPIRTLLTRARWTERAPRAAIVLWQSLIASLALALLAAVFVAFELPGRTAPPRQAIMDSSPHTYVVLPSGGASPEALFLLTAVLIGAALLVGALGLRSVGLARARTQRRLLIDLVCTERQGMPGVRVLPHPQATAFSLAGMHPRVVVSDGAIALLAPDELAAVVAHERAHVRARHDLVLLPFATIAQALPRSKALTAMRDRVGLLVELAADDRVLRSGEPVQFARALCRMAAAGPPAEHRTEDDDAPLRVARALSSRVPSKAIAGTSALATGALLLLPLAAFLIPLGGR